MMEQGPDGMTGPDQGKRGYAMDNHHNENSLPAALPPEVRGPEVGVSDMADARESRVMTQLRLLSAYGKPVISFTMNIMGPVKVFPLSVRSFNEGVRLIRLQLRAFHVPVLEEALNEAVTGYEAFWAADGDLRHIKEILCLLEEHLSIGRLFDIDVIGPGGVKISRTELGFPGRKCLLCGKDTFVCSRARSHTVPELLEKSCSLMRTYFSEQTAERLSSLSMQALLYEVSVTPKPGLVDRNNNGAHKDMDIFTFEASAVSLNRWFREFALCGLNAGDDPMPRVFSRLRSAGIEAEDCMFRATGGINTHKGLIFSLSVLNCAMGILMRDGGTPTPGEVSSTVRLLTSDIMKDFEGVTEETAKTHGEKLYAKYGIRGIRGEAASGYATVTGTGLRVLSSCLAGGWSFNDAGAATLLHIIAETEDSNIVSRSSYEELLEIRDRIRKKLKECGFPETEGSLPASSAGHDCPSGTAVDAPGELPSPAPLLAFAEELDREFIARNISPGGSADLLALTFFVYFCLKGA